MNDNDSLPLRRPRLRLVVTTPPVLLPVAMVLADHPDDAGAEEDESDDEIRIAGPIEASPYSALLGGDISDDLRAEALRGLWRGTFCAAILPTEDGEP